ncbi:Putative Mss4-like superfamily protein [Septoria linicola]|uniref:Mss4-like superfamily protein n=1 Tax=Septoria linicola TaxID=215465 RepID=A0A9Q9EHB9_9PEZI|nr:putative Mss4-like superfamily protein [Septoria linicola]USW49742.1 Putative Mss4-like superfamily protein [Septoria linicola]
MSLCHLSGGPYQAFAGVKSQDVTFFDNQEKLRYEGLPRDTIGGIVFLRFSKVGERAFCSSCYTPLAMRYKHEAEIVALALGAIDEESLTAEVKDAFRLAAHIFAGQKAWWVDIEQDGLPKHDRFSGDFEANMDER